ncbi:calcium/calmodulin-dependent protein kinase II [Monosporozyma unispora]|nr:Calmodulin-dependent protein kinase cmk2 [Kazachstania unispora]
MVEQVDEHGVVKPEIIKGHMVSKFITRLAGQPESYINRSNYEFGKTLGAGTFGVVRKAKKLDTNEDVAVKVILKKALKGKGVEFQSLYDELKMLQQLSHPNIVQFKDWFESKDKFYIVTQLATGGELFDRILERGKFTEGDAINIVVQMLKAVQYMHSKNIVHRDLKPENVLYIDKSPDSQIVIADLGIAKKLDDNNDLIYKAAGSLGYVAPEVLTDEGHGKPCDIWSLGVITYTLLCGYSPFIAENVEGFLEECTRHRYPVTFHSPYWDSISDEAKKFILRALLMDPNERPTATELLQDEWIVAKGIEYRDTNILPGVKKGFSLRHKLRDAIELVMINNRIRQLKNLYLSAEEGADSDLDIEESPLDPIETITQSLKDLRVQSQNTMMKLTQDQKRMKSCLTQDAFALIVKAAAKNKDLLKCDKKEKEPKDKKEDIQLPTKE